MPKTNILPPQSYLIHKIPCKYYLEKPFDGKLDELTADKSLVDEHNLDDDTKHRLKTFQLEV